ncbi:glycylpeptide N-tetradecanoyltransferase [Scheffersomyces spartinae]|uniref:Glycylpeptide N-tetradecanoyltransferase n=1 Tax=Scheffersomyces spartinae TaxID=45513 RepID=A0A9P7VC74_9ASCO|nr:glycylpeptide N-tetradecanoyltransferase [Scheffersomyces spartinae]KAG7195289.1 glycylpeptide N-tetradecanoyltransferase [Scheffersomyces spartinae]
MSGKENGLFDPKLIEELLRKLAMGDPLSEKQQKEMKDYKFWKTQPVPLFDEKSQADGPIDSVRTPDDIPDTPLKLLSSFEWVTLDVENEDDLDQIYTLLYENYVEDVDSTLRFKYSHDFFKWALKPPGWRKDWHVGVKVKGSGKLVGFISAVPMTLNLKKGATEFPCVEINFLCIHKKLRDKRLAPTLIKEITRRVNKQNIWQALYTAGVVLPAPVSVCRYTHRPINWSKLHDVGFSHLPQGESKSSMIAKYALPSETKTKGWREMKLEDVDQVHALITEYQKRFDIVQVFSKEEISHWLLDVNSCNPENKVICSYVVENSDGRITDFISYYLLPFTILNDKTHNELGIAYLFYYATDLADKDGYKKRLISLVNDALVTAKKLNVDVFNCLTSQDNNLFIDEAKFAPGDGYLNYYLFNYRTKTISGGINVESKEILKNSTSGVGVVML